MQTCSNIIDYVSRDKIISVKPLMRVWKGIWQCEPTCSGTAGSISLPASWHHAAAPLHRLLSSTVQRHWAQLPVRYLRRDRPRCCCCSFPNRHSKGCKMCTDVTCHILDTQVVYDIFLCENALCIYFPHFVVFSLIPKRKIIGKS